jgi:glycosyltransferase involved in cell wall biosynthesis
VTGRGSVSPALTKSFDAVHEVTPFRRGGPRSIARAGKELSRVVREERTSLLHVHSPYGIALGRLTARTTRTPHLAVVHGTLFDYRTRAGRLFSSVEIVSARLTSTYVTENPDDQRIYRRIAPRSEVHLAPCGGAGIDRERLRADAATAPEASNRPPRILIMGRLTPDKNLDVAVSAWRLARQSTPDLELRIVGSTAPGEPAWIPPTDPGISTLPWTARPGAELANADVVLSTSLREGFPMTLAEALVVGTPVVAVDNRGSRAIADQVQQGMILVPERVAAISSAILANLRAPTVRVAPSVLESWGQDFVVAFHIERILEAVGN